MHWLTPDWFRLQWDALQPPGSNQTATCDVICVCSVRHFWELQDGIPICAHLAQEANNTGGRRHWVRMGVDWGICLSHDKTQQHSSSTSCSSRGTWAWTSAARSFLRHWCTIYLTLNKTANVTLTGTRLLRWSDQRAGQFNCFVHKNHILY